MPHEWIKKVQHTCTMEYYSAIKRDKLDHLGNMDGVAN